jgi:hypothetical protein
VLPAVYPDYHPKKGQNDPNAGKPDLYALCKAFYLEWHHRIKSGQIKSVPRGSVYHVENDTSEPENADYSENDESDETALYTSTTRKQITSRSVCGVCGGRGHYGRVEGMDCLTKQLGISIPRSELALTKYPSGITFPFSDTSGSSSAAHRKHVHDANLASSSRRSGKSRQVPHKPNPKFPKSSLKHKPKRVSQVDEHDSELVEHEEYTEQDDDQVSDDDPRVDFATFAVNYHTIETRYNTHHSYSDESSDDELSTNKYRLRHRK